MICTKKVGQYMKNFWSTLQNISGFFIFCVKENENESGRKRLCRSW